jgi:NlpC/P60 family putative phage cell wall peptidase
MVTRDMIVKAALPWVGTPFAHFQCCRGAGVDCANLILGVGRDAGIFSSADTLPYYSPQWHMHGPNTLLVDTLRQRGFVEKDAKLLEPADVLVFELGINQCHAAIALSANRIIHARNGRITKKVVCCTLPLSWRTRHLKTCFAYPMLMD